MADREKLEDVILSCTCAMAGMVAEEKKKELQRSSVIKDEIRILEAEKRRLSGRKLRIYEDYRSDRLTKEQCRKEYETVADRILEIEKRIPELEEWIEIVWKIDNRFFREVAGEKEVLAVE